METSRRGGKKYQKTTNKNKGKTYQTSWKAKDRGEISEEGKRNLTEVVLKARHRWGRTQ